jgi:hypothetical protein
LQVGAVQLPARRITSIEQRSNVLTGKHELLSAQTPQLPSRVFGRLPACHLRRSYAILALEQRRRSVRDITVQVGLFESIGLE